MSSASRHVAQSTIYNQFVKTVLSHAVKILFVSESGDKGIMGWVVVTT